MIDPLHSAFRKHIPYTSVGRERMALRRLHTDITAKIIAGKAEGSTLEGHVSAMTDFSIMTLAQGREHVKFANSYSRLAMVIDVAWRMEDGEWITLFGENWTT